jgi:hypothetical protein
MEPGGDATMPGKSHLSAIPSEDVFATGGFTVDPNQTFSALTVPESRIFVLTDVIVFPLVEKSDPDFVVRYRIEEHAPGAPIGTGSKFQYNTVGTGENWSQHFTSGIGFAGKTEVTVVNTTFSTGRTGFQLLGYFTEL